MTQECTTAVLDTSEIRVTIESLLREHTRASAPEIAAMLDRGEVEGAASAFLAHLDAEVATR